MLRVVRRLTFARIMSYLSFISMVIGLIEKANHYRIRFKQSKARKKTGFGFAYPSVYNNQKTIVRRFLDNK